MFPSATPPGSPALGQVPEHLLMAVNSMNSPPPISSTITTTAVDPTIANTIANNLANSIVNSMANSNAPNNGNTNHGSIHPQNKMSPTSNSSPGGMFTPPNNVNINHLSNIPNLSNITNMANMAGVNRMSSPIVNAFNNSTPSSSASNGGSSSNVPVNNIATTSSSGYMDHNGQPSPLPFTSSNGAFSRKSPPTINQGFNHMTSHVTSLPSSIGRLTLGLTGHYPPSPILEHEDIHSPVSSGGGMSPPLSPPPPTSPAPTMVPTLSGTDRRESLSSSSPGSGGLAGLHHALHGLHNLHNLHNLHSLQNLQTQMAALAGLQGGLGVPGVSSLLHSHLAAQHSPGPAPENIGTSIPSNSANNGSSTSNQSGGNQSSVPQMVLTAGQVAQGVQGAQLLIPTSQGIAVQPILTIPLGQAGSMNATSSLVNPLTPLHHLSQQQQPQHQQPSQHHQHHQQSRSGSTASSPLPTSSSSSSSSSTSSHPLLGLAGLPPTLFHPHHGGHNNNNNNSTNNNNIGNPEKPKLPLPLSSPVQESISSLSARLGGAHYPHHHAPPPSRYSPDFLDTHNQPTISQSTGNVVDGVNLDEIKEFAKAFKIRRLSLGLTQTQVGQALSITEGPAYSQSAICRFEKLDITPKSAQKIKPVLERWMQEAEDRYKNGQHTLTDFMGNEPSKKRKRRTSFTPQALEVLNAHFERNTHPSGAEITAMAEQLGYEREVVRIWFCNKRQALKNTVRMMAKGAPAPPPPPPPPPHSSIN